ncbi:MAG TPA: CHAP domain-containing protein [Ktedonobacteraceae bacterium]|nr:CHAP domain-containing protein [Ktedonobacteraceae bacterium]
MHISRSWSIVRYWKSSSGLSDRRRMLHILAILFFFALIWLEMGNASAGTFNHTNASVDYSCSQAYFSPDGNPFPLCPGPYPSGGNCVWWAWEQWHLLGYNLPLNWGNAADWIVDAERFGLPVGTTPRVGSIAVFPRADGVWAFGTAGHAAFVTWVSPDSSTFNVTYQNYGDPTPMFIGNGYNVSYINQPRYQDGELRFIYFPKVIDPTLFARLPGVNGNSVAQVSSVNNMLMSSVTSSGSLASSELALGLPPGSYDQEFSADFTGNGLTDLLLYNRQQGRLDVLTLQDKLLPNYARLAHDRVPNDTQEAAIPQRVSLSDKTTPVNGWGSNLDIRIGDFDGDGHADILLYDLVTGKIQLISLTPELTIKKHVILPGWGPGWELYVGQFDGKRSGVFMYNRFAVPQPSPLPSPTPNPSPSPNPSGTPGPSPTPSPSPSPTPSPSPSPSPSPTPSPSPSPSPSPTPVPSEVVPSPTPTLTPSPSPSPTPSATPTKVPTRGPLPSQTANPTESPSPDPAGTGQGSNVVMDVNYGSTRDYSDLTYLSGPPGATSQSQLTADVMVVDFDNNFSISHVQKYGLLYNSWEVYVGRFVNPQQDGVFLYDRNSGEARIMDFTGDLEITNYHELHNLEGNWEVHTGDFNGSGRAQVLLYDPSSGDAQFLVFTPKLSLAHQKSLSSPGSNLVLYVGHFGMPTLSVMLYDPQAAQSTFIAFDSSLDVARQVTVDSWDQSWQILIGAFLDRSRCLANHTCASGDDILLLNRNLGELEQYIFSFGNQYNVFDNRSQSFVRDGVAPQGVLSPVDTTTFGLVITLDTSIHGEEIY